MSPSEQVYQPAAAPRVTGLQNAAPGVDAPARPMPPSNAVPPSGQPHAPRPDQYRPGVSGPAPTAAGPRKVRLTIARVDPWSVLKLSFLLSVAMGIGLVTAAVILWSVVNSMGVFDQLNSTIKEIGGTNSTFNLYDYVGLGRVVSLSTFIGVINIIILMALSTLGAFLYNIAATLVGGLHVTLSDD